MSERSFSVFYRHYEHDVTIKSTEPEILAADRLAAVAEHLLSSEDNFFGILDNGDAILQLYLDDDGSIVAELIYPDVDGCFRARMSLQEVTTLLGRLPSVFTEDLLPGAQFIG